MVINRVVLACCWFGVDAWYGGQMVKIMIGAIWRERFEILLLMHSQHLAQRIFMR